MHSPLGIDAVEVHKDIRDDGATPGCQMADDSLFALGMDLFSATHHCFKRALI